MAGGGTISTTATKIEALKLQSSTYGATLAAIFGVTRVSGNMLWYGGFTAHKHVKKQRAGKGGGTTVKNETYTYTANVAMGISEGPILGIPRVWRGKDQFTGGIAASQVVTTTETYAVPGGGGAKTLTHASGWRCTVAVHYTGTIDVGDGTTSGPVYLAEGTDYTVAAGVYTFGAQWTGKTLTIEYQYLTGSLTQSGLAKLGLTMFAGAVGQATWSVLSTGFSAQAIPYSGIAYVAAQDYDLGEDATVQNHNFEVQGRMAYHLGSSVQDVDPALVTFAMLTDGRYGALFPSGRLNLSLWSRYCRAAGLLFSPAFTEQLSAAELVQTMGRLTNAAPVWSAGALKMLPYGDTALTGNGATYTPNVTPLYDLSDDHFLPRDGGGEPVKATPRPSRDAKNHVRIEYLDRSQDYNVSIAEWKDQADIDTTGLRSADVIKAHWIADRDVATKVAQLVGHRMLYVRNEYSFRLPWTFALLEPMDLVTLTEPYLDLAQAPVRIIAIDEDEDGALEVTAEEYPAGIATASLYGSQGGNGYVADYNADPGDVLAPAIFEAPGERTLTGVEVYAAVTSANANWGGCRVWVSLDGVGYNNIATIYGGARYGTLTGSIAGGNLPVQLHAAEQIVSGSAVDAASLTSLCYIGGSTPEYLAHQGATLTGTGAYTLAGLVRGAYGTSSASAHTTGDLFVRVDEAVAKSGPLELSMIGKTIYFKFTSFNVFGRAEQDLADVTEYSHAITGAMAALGAGRAKVVTLAASGQVFTFASAGTADPSGQSITLEAHLQNTVAATATWTTTPTVTLGGSGNSRTLAVADFGANTSVKVRATADGVYDEITIVRLTQGESGVRALLSNETASLPADSGGTVSSYVGSGTQIRVYEGTTLLDYDGTGTAAGKWTVSRAGTNITPGAASSSGSTPIRLAVIAAHSAMTAVGAYVDYTISGKTIAGVAFSFVERQVLSKSLAGSDGFSVVPSKELAGIPCNAAGVPFSGAFTNATGHLTAYAGGADVTSACTYSAVATGCTGSVNTALNTPVTGPKGAYRITALSGEEGYLAITVTYGSKSVTRVITAQKVRAGADARYVLDETISSPVTGTSYSAVHGTTPQLTVGAGGTITVAANISAYYGQTNSGSCTLTGKIQYRDVAIGAWTDVSGASATGTTATWNAGLAEWTYGSMVIPPTTMAAPGSLAQYEFRLQLYQSGNPSGVVLLGGVLNAGWSG